MSQSVAVSTIQERVRVLCDLPTFSTDSPVTSDAILDFIKVACAMLAGKVKQASGEQYLTASTTLTTTANVSTVAVPSQFSDVIRLSWIRSASDEIPLEVADVDNWEAYPNSWNSFPQGLAAPKYRLIGDTITLFPTPDSSAYTLKLYYTTGLYPTSTGSTISARDGWDQWVTLQTCILVRARQQKDSTEFQVALAQLDASIMAQLKRDKFGVRQVRDLRTVQQGPYRRRPY